MDQNRKWTTWFYSDPHFGHENIIEYCDRPFKNKDEMKEEMIQSYNNLVSPGDLVIFTGDVFFHHGKDEMKETLDRMHGRKILVRGNHDHKPRTMMNAGFHISVESMELVIANERVLISHYPFAMPRYRYKILTFFNKIKRKLGLKIKPLEKYHHKRPTNKGQFLIHGHTHDKIAYKGRQIHVGVDAWGYKPVNIQEISNLICKIKRKEKNNG